MDFAKIIYLLALTWLRTCSCHDYATSPHWDYLTFSQKWPVSFCIYHNLQPTSEPMKRCLLPKDRWTIHGLWPNRVDGNHPSYCNTSVPFDDEKIQPIKRKLEKFWPNLESDKSADSLWKHEWEKHGTCAMELEMFDSERKYFEGGLNLYGKYNMTSLLGTLQILPSNEKKYTAANLITRIRERLSKAPYVECVQRSSTKQYYVYEIRLCFDKDIRLIDCLPSLSESHALTNCPEDVAIFYPKRVNSDVSPAHLASRRG